MKLGWKVWCPNNPTHNRFTATLRREERCYVDNTGEWYEVLKAKGSIISGPHLPDPVCKFCGAVAVVSKKTLPTRRKTWQEP